MCIFSLSSILVSAPSVQCTVGINLTKRPNTHYNTTKYYTVLVAVKCHAEVKSICEQQFRRADTRCTFHSVCNAKGYGVSCIDLISFCYLCSSRSISSYNFSSSALKAFSITALLVFSVGVNSPFSMLNSSG